MKSWAASIALHGVAFGLATLVWLDPGLRAVPEPMRWQVAFTPAPPPPSKPARETPPPMPKQVQAPPPEPAPPPVPDPPAPVSPAPPPPQPVPAPPPPHLEPAPPAPAPALVEVPAPARAAAEPARVQAPAPVSAPAPVAAQAAPRQTAAFDAAAEAERRWYQALLEQLRTMKRYPLAARRLGQEGVVLIEARIGADGRLENTLVKRGSGYPLLDRDALRLLEEAAEIARDQMRPERPTRLEIPIAYRLER